MSTSTAVAAAAAALMAPRRSSSSRASEPRFAGAAPQHKQRSSLLTPVHAASSSAKRSAGDDAASMTTTATTMIAPTALSPLSPLSQPAPLSASPSSSAGWWAAPPTFVASAAQQRGETTAAAVAASASTSAPAPAPPAPPPPPPTTTPPPTLSPSPLLSAATGPRPRVAYQGVPGAYSEAAALASFPGCDPVPCRTFEGAFQAAAQWSADAAVVPIENSLGGSIHAVYDLLLRYGDGLRIVGEVGVAVSHCLLAPAGTRLEDLEEVTSHPQALAQCEGFIRSLAASSSSSSSSVGSDDSRRRKIARVAAEDTAGSAAELAARWAAAAAAQNREGAGDGGEEGKEKEGGTKKIRTTAVIASARAAELYGLEILASDIQDAEASSNVTRFLVLVREPAAPRPSPGDARQHKASVVFSLPDGPGALFRALSVFALRDISMTKVESRPARDAPLLLEEGEETEEEEEDDLSSSSFEEEDGDSNVSTTISSRRRRRRFNYLFYLDVRANTADPLAQNALRHLREIAPFMRVLGCYPEMSGEPVGLPRVAEGEGGLRGGIMRGRRQGVLGGVGVGGTAAAAAKTSSPLLPLSATSASSSPSSSSSSPPPRVAYQGVPGAYSEGAALAAVPGCAPLPCEQFSDAFEALSSGEADRAVLPIENSLGGSIHAVYDLLLRHRLHVVGEASVKVDHCLMARKGTKLENVRRVSSHWQALAQVAGYLRSLNGGLVEPVVADDTAGAAKALSLGGGSSGPAEGEGGKEEGGAEAAVASARAAELYGLEILARSIQDNPANMTRFLVLAREPALLSPSAIASSSFSPAAAKKREKKKKAQKRKNNGAFRASVAVALPDGPGTLFKVLSVFALRDIDLTKIESGPLTPSVLEEMQRSGLVGAGAGGGGGAGASSGGDGSNGSLPSPPSPLLQQQQNSSLSGSSSSSPGPFGDVFYVDVAANLAEEAPQNALRHLQEIAPFMRVLGCYPVSDAAE